MTTVSPKTEKVHIIGGGLAGSEAAWQLVQRGHDVVIHEMRPIKPTFAHVTDHLAELVCSNSFRSDDDEYNAVGLLHHELRACNSIIMACAKDHQVPAGGALAVDRHGFSEAVQHKLLETGKITISREEITELPSADWGPTIIATGPLTSEPLSAAIARATGQDALSFFDAIAPIVHKDSIDFSKAWLQSRYDKGDGKDYINCGMTQEQYNDFIDALLAGDKTEFKDWEKDTPYFEGCLPIEVMAERGRETLTFGPMKPVGLTNPNAPDANYHAVVQLRQDNALGTLYNMVGFQTKLKYAPQKEIFRKIPGLENAEFARLGGIHRNTFINSPKVLNEFLTLTSCNNLRFAGQVTGCEGYVESTAIGLLAGIFTAQELAGTSPTRPPETTALGALLGHITENADSETFQPMNVNFGLFPPVDPVITVNGKRRKLKGKDRKKAYTDRAKHDIQPWLTQL